MESSETVEIIMGNYKYTEKYCIGQGSFGKVYKGTNIHTNKQVAIKQMDSQLVTQQEIASEITILKQLRHPHIVEYQDAFQNNGFFYIVTEYCKGGDLRNFFEGDSDIQDSDCEIENDEREIQKQYQEKTQKIISMLKQVCLGFEYLKTNNIIHRDLKPSNILLHEGKYKIADFGLAKRETVHKSIVNQDLFGVPIYMSPQILSKNYYTYKCDVWSLGIVIFEMFFEELPWKSSDVQGLFFQIMIDPFPYYNKFDAKNNKHAPKIPPVIQFLLRSTLQYLEKNRISWKELLTAVSEGFKTFEQQKLESIKSKQDLPSKQSTPTLPVQPNKSIPFHEIQILHHIFSQARSIQSELIELISSQENYRSFLHSIARYLSKGLENRPVICDCFYMLLKRCGENLHVFMIDLERLEDGRELLIFLELVHDFVFACNQSTKEGFRKKIGSTNRNDKIDQYAAFVISKINTFSMNREFEVKKMTSQASITEDPFEEK